MPGTKKQPRTIHTILNEVIERVNGDTQRLRVLEQSAESLISRVNTLEQAMLQNRRDLEKTLSEINSKITSAEDRIAKTENTMKEVINHIKKLVTQSQMKELQDMIEIYNPVKSSFVTKEEMEKIVNEKLHENSRKSK